MKLDQLLKNKKLLVIVLSVVAVLAIVLNLQTFGITWVSRNDVITQKAEADKLAQKLKEVQADYKYEEDKVWNLNALLRNFWQPKFDGDGMETFKPLVEKIAKESNIKFSYIGNVRRSGSSGLISYSVPISGSAPFSVLLPFMKKIDKHCPHIGWQTLNLVLNRSNETQIDFSGTLRVLCLENPEVLALLEKVTKPHKSSKAKSKSSAKSVVSKKTVNVKKTDAKTKTEPVTKTETEVPLDSARVQIKVKSGEKTQKNMSSAPAAAKQGKKSSQAEEKKPKPGDMPEPPPEAPAPPDMPAPVDNGGSEK